MAGNLHPAQTQTGRCLFQRWICVCSGCPCRKALPYSGNYPRIRYHTGTCKQNCNPRCKKVCCNFPETMKYLPAEKAVLTGSPIRRELFHGDAEKSLHYCGFPDHSKPVLLIVGGSSGSKVINETVRKVLPELLEQFYIIHLCGKGNLDEKLKGVIGYAQFEYASAELTDMFALADLAISRAGANSICELLALHKPNILIPLSAAASRGDQILNAKSFAKQGFSYVIEEEKLTDQTLLDAVREVYADREKYIHTMSESGQMDSIGTILKLIESVSK